MNWNRLVVEVEICSGVMDHNHQKLNIKAKIKNFIANVKNFFAAPTMAYTFA